MQLGKLRHSLALATCTLLGSPAVDAAKAAETNLDISQLNYQEKGRVSITEQVMAITKSTNIDESVRVTLIHDTMTGATPNGAAASSDPQSFTSPSGGSYRNEAGQPLSPFSDERTAISASRQQAIGKRRRLIYGGNYSTEQDYASIGVNTEYQRDTKNKMQTYTLAAALSHDIIEAEGGIPYGLSPISDTRRYDSDTKNTLNLLAGITQILDKRTLLQLNYNIEQAKGYLTDPYKLISVNGGTDPLQYEQRPGSRLSHSVYSRLIHNRHNNVYRLAYRYFWDDWGISAHTFDIKYHHKLKKSWYLQPHFRFYTQQAADFYNYRVYSDTPVEDAASADYRLGNLDTLTVGIQTGMAPVKNARLNFRVGYIQQSDRLNQFESVSITITQLSFSYLF